MLRINCEEWITLKRLIRVRANELTDGTTEAQLWNDACRAFHAGFFDHAGVVLIDKVGDRVLSLKDWEVWRYLPALADRIFVSKKAAHDLWCNRSPLACCADATKGGSQPSRSPQQLPPALDAMINEALRSEYRRANATGEKPPNVNEVTGPVQLALAQQGRWASKRGIQKLAEAEEFKRLRWPPGKRRSEPRKK